MTKQEFREFKMKLFEFVNEYEDQLNKLEAKQEKKEKDTTPDGMVSQLQKGQRKNTLTKNNYNTSLYAGVISDVERKNSTNDNPMIIITADLDNGTTPKKAFTYIDGNGGTKYHLLNDFMKPLRITGFSNSTPIEQFFEFPFEDYIGTRVRVSLDGEYNGIPQIGKFYLEEPVIW